MDFGSCGYTIFMPGSWQNIPSFAGEAASSSALHRHHLVDFPEKRHTKMTTFHDDRLLDIELRHFPTHAKRCLDVFALASKVVGSIDWQPTTKLWAFAITMLSQISPVLLIWYIDYGNGRKTMPHRKWFYSMFYVNSIQSPQFPDSTGWQDARIKFVYIWPSLATRCLTFWVVVLYLVWYHQMEIYHGISIEIYIFGFKGWIDK